MKRQVFSVSICAVLFGATIAFAGENVWLDAARELQENPDKYEDDANRFKKCMEECDRRHNMYAEKMTDEDMRNHGRCQTQCIDGP